MSVLFGLYISKLRIREIGGTSVRDQYGRTVDYIRVSITDRCNLRCRYCMPEGIELVSMEEILTYEEIERICTAAAKTGIRKLKITGGEPLVRLGCAELIGRLKQIPGMEQVTLTTNGVLLKEQLPDLKAAGLDAVNISLDSLDRESYRKITGRDQLPLVLESIESVLESGIVAKVNSVLLKSVNEKEWEDLAGLAERYPLDVRFIEMEDSLRRCPMKRSERSWNCDIRKWRRMNENMGTDRHNIIRFRDFREALALSVRSTGNFAEAAIGSV